MLALIGSTRGLVHAGSVGPGNLAEISSKQVETIIIDLNGISQLDESTTRWLRLQSPAALILADPGSLSFHSEFIEGSLACAMRTDSGPVLRVALEALRDGRSFTSDNVLIQQRLTRLADELSSAERQLMCHTLDGRSLGEVATALGINEIEAANCRDNLMEQFDLHSAAALTRFAEHYVRGEQT